MTKYGSTLRTGFAKVIQQSYPAITSQINDQTTVTICWWFFLFKVLLKQLNQE